jgi:hypothetical protein
MGRILARVAFATERERHLKMSERANPMNWFKRDPERDRFYLLPGMGGRAARAKHRRILNWSIAIGLLVSLAVAGAIYLANRPGL